MEETQIKPQHNFKKKLPYFIGGVLVFVASLGLFFAYRANILPTSKKPDFTKVSAVTGVTIPISIKNDGAGMYFEHNGERLSPTNHIADLLLNTKYTLTLTNASAVKQGMFIPVLKEDVVVEPGQSVSLSMSFSNPGTYYFLGNVYQPGWDGLSSGFDVATNTIKGASPTSAVKPLPPVTSSGGVLDVVATETPVVR
ncbi:hypothetical protein KBB12_02075 [Candidatus Woesebacteria bacterium]|nr:hypothetical protein [Candidatus Woesebacteria bacterium]